MTTPQGELLATDRHSDFNAEQARRSELLAAAYEDLRIHRGSVPSDLLMDLRQNRTCQAKIEDSFVILERFPVLLLPDYFRERWLALDEGGNNSVVLVLKDEEGRRYHYFSLETGEPLSVFLQRADAQILARQAMVEVFDSARLRMQFT